MTGNWEGVDFGGDVEPDSCANFPGGNALYMYVDEAGNFDFSPSGSQFFVLTCLTVCRPFPAHPTLLDVKYDHLETGLDLEYFHASEDRQSVRDSVFAAIQRSMAQYRAYSVIIRKNRTNPVLRGPERFYPRVFEWLMKYVIPRRTDAATKTVVVITDSIPVQSKRKAIEKAVKSALKPLVPKSLTYRLYHHQSRADLNLQIADYFSWAVFRKWESQDVRSYNLISSAMRAEGDLFANGDMEYY